MAGLCTNPILSDYSLPDYNLPSMCALRHKGYILASGRQRDMFSRKSNRRNFFIILLTLKPLSSALAGCCVSEAPQWPRSRRDSRAIQG